MPNERIIKTDRREGFRLWFEFLKVALTSPDPIIRKALKDNAGYYDKWDMDEANMFDDWWEDHKHLFQETATVRQLKVGDLPASDDSIVIEVPLTASTSIILEKIKNILEAAYARQGKINKKSRKKKTSVFHLSQGSEPKFLAIRDMLNIYRDVYLKNPKLKGASRLDALYSYYRTRKHKAWRNIPLIFLTGRNGDEDRALRNVNRYIQNAKKITLNVANGEFPGEY